MNLDNWLLSDGKIYKLVDIFSSEKEAYSLAQVLNENCHTKVQKLKNGSWGVYWRPHTGVLCPFGVV